MHFDFLLNYQVHSKGLLFHKIDTLFPNESPDSKATRILSFEPVTRGSFLKGIANINRIFSNSSYKVEASETTIEECKKEAFNGKNLFGYFLENWLNVCLGEDPNSLMVVYPPEYVEEYGINHMCFVTSENILWVDRETIVFKSIEESKISYDLNRVPYSTQVFFDPVLNKNNIFIKRENTFNTTLEKKFEETVFHCFHENELYRVQQDKEDKDKYNVEIWPCKNFDLPPCKFVEGVKNNKVNESFLNGFIPFGNLALLQHSQHIAVNFNFSFPRMSEVVTPCDYPLCQDGYIVGTIDALHPDGQWECPQCHGSGEKSIQSPYKVYRKKFDPSGMQENKELMDVKPVEFFTPDVAILDYSKGEWKNYLEMAEMAIYIQQKVKTGNVESEGSKLVDLDELHAFLIGVAKAFFHGLKFAVQCYENYYNSNPIPVSINTPYSFAILTEAEAFDNLNKILTSGAPDIIKGNEIDNFLSKFVSDNSPVKKAYQVLKKIDILLLKSTGEITTLKQNFVVTADQWAIHALAYSVLMQMYSNDETLFNEDLQTIADRLSKELEKYKPKESDLKTQAMDQFS